MELGGHPGGNRWCIFCACVQLLKPRIVAMVLVACAIGLLLAGGQAVSFHTCWTLFATALLAGGACALNQYLDRDADALMERTWQRALPAGIIPPSHALAFGLLLVLAGGAAALFRINLLTALLGLLSVFLYVLVYTPLKRISWLNTPVGAIPGALPALMGWASVSGRIDAGGWVLFAMVFLWQHVHFYSIAWMHRADYRRGGFLMLPVVHPDGRSTFRRIVFAATALLPISLLLAGLHLVGPVYCFGAPLAGVGLLVAGIELARRPSPRAAHVVLFSSLCYLPVLLGMIIFDRWL